MTKTDKGLCVVETGKTPAAVKLVRAHAEAVSRFLKNGVNEMWTAHPSPLEDKESEE